MPTALVTRALERAVVQRAPAPGLLHHSGRGSQQAGEAYRTLLRQHGVHPSMSRLSQLLRQRHGGELLGHAQSRMLPRRTARQPAWSPGSNSSTTSRASTTASACTAASATNPRWRSRKACATTKINPQQNTESPIRVFGARSAFTLWLPGNPSRPSAPAGGCPTPNVTGPRSAEDARPYGGERGAEIGRWQTVHDTPDVLLILRQVQAGQRW